MATKSTPAKLPAKKTSAPAKKPAAPAVKKPAPKPAIDLDDDEDEDEDELELDGEEETPEEPDLNVFAKLGAANQAKKAKADAEPQENEEDDDLAGLDTDDEGEENDDSTEDDVAENDDEEEEALVDENLALVARLTDSSASLEAVGGTSFELPPCVDTEETTDNPASIKLVIEAHAAGCLDCTHLVPSGSTEYSKCHFSAGNVNCPAQSVKIVFVGRRNLFTAKLAAARAAQDSNKVLRILAGLENEDLELKDYVLRQVGLV